MDNSQSAASSSPTNLKRKLKSPYVLTPTVVKSIVALLNEEFVKLSNPFTQKYEVNFQEARRQEFNSLESVLQLDNSAEEPITELSISFSAPDHWYDAEHHYQKGSHSYDVRLRFLPDKSWGRGIDVEVRSSDPGWAESTLPRILSQVERTRNRSIAHRFMKSSLVSGILLVISYAIVAFVIVLFSALLSVSGGSNSPKLSRAQVDSLLNDANQAQTIDEKVQFLFQLQRSQLESERHHSRSAAAAAILSRPSVTAFLTSIVLFGFVAYSWWKHYPLAVFLWGDYEEQYDRVVKFREYILIGVVVGFGLSVLGNLFWLGVLG